jgi:hypothetical protein
MGYKSYSSISVKLRACHFVHAVDRYTPHPALPLVICDKIIISQWCKHIYMDHEDNGQICYRHIMVRLYWLETEWIDWLETRWLHWLETRWLHWLVTRWLHWLVTRWLHWLETR